MSDPLTSIKGMTDELAEKLKAHNIHHTEHLVAAGLDQKDRKALADKLGVNVSHLGELVNRADLSRIKGIAGVYADLLENAGVDSVKELAHRVPANLHSKLEEINGKQKLTSRTPTLSAVEGWVKEAQALSK